MDTRNRPLIWLDAFYRYLLMNSVSGLVPIYIVSEYPKSGGTWVGQMLSDALNIPFPRNQLFSPKMSLLHTHLCYSSRLSNVVCVFRDGRDIMVSYYYHCLFESDKNSPILVRNFRNALQFDDYNDIKSHLHTFIKFINDRDSKSLSPYRFTWGEFVTSWANKDCIQVKYESLVENPIEEMLRIFKELDSNEVTRTDVEKIVETYSFANQTKRPRGVENVSSFLRKGTPGDWKNKFSHNAALTFDELYGNELILLGYEKNNSWINNLR